MICDCLYLPSFTRFPSKPLMMRVPFFLMLTFSKATPKSKGIKGTTGVPSSLSTTEPCSVRGHLEGYASEDRLLNLYTRKGQMKAHVAP